MNPTTIESLMVVIRSSVQAVRLYTTELDALPDHSSKAQGVLAALTAEADVLSAALARFAGLSDRSLLHDEDENEFHHDPAIDELAHRLARFCTNCGGWMPDVSNQS